MSELWYAAYGSNIHEQRFLCYLQGGKPTYGKVEMHGATDPSPPSENRVISIPHALYFSLPDGRKDTANWGYGGVAFVEARSDQSVETLCRIWKISEDQYEEVRAQEGAAYKYELDLGEIDGLPVRSFTHEHSIEKRMPPSESYLATIALGLKEAYQLNTLELFDYFSALGGIQGKLSPDLLLEMLQDL